MAILGFGGKSTDPTVGVPSAAEPAAPWGEIFTMPVPSVSQPVGPQLPLKAKGKRPRWLIFVLLGLLVLIGGLGTYLAFYRAAPTPAPTESNSTPTAPTTPSVQTPTPSVPTTPTTTPAERDRIRFGDISTLQSMLKLYAADNGGKYPVSPLQLVLGGDSSASLSSAGFAAQAQGTTYLAVVPQNPLPNGAPYLYQSADGTTYTLSFNLEEGTGGLPAGDNVATPAGLGSTAQTTPTPTIPPGMPATVTPPQPTVDTDKDGLTDAEELIFGTDPTKVDSDGDSYSDGLEVAGGFDPAVGHGALLKNAASLATYQSSRFGYTAYYPKAWLARATDSEGSEVVFTGADASEFMEVLVVDNPEHLSASAWYANQITGLTPTQVPTVTLGSLTWVQSLDGLNAYLATDRYIITLSYNIGTKTQASYYALYKAMLSLFSISPSTAGQPITPPVPSPSLPSGTNPSSDNSSTPLTTSPSATGGGLNSNTNVPPSPPPSSNTNTPG